MTIEQMITREVQRGLKPLLDEVKREIIAAVKTELTRRSLTEGGAGKASEPLKLITKDEARKRLGVNKNSLNELVEAGEIMTATPPGGRSKIVENSLNEYIQKITKEGAA